MTRLSINTNIASLTATRQQANTVSDLSRIFERLSSGQRINRAADDAAGLAIADALRSNSRVFTRGMQNINDGISYLAIQESALKNLNLIIQRQMELAEQSANGVYTELQRKPLNDEAKELTREYNRIVQSVSFNGIKILEDAYNQLNIQAGFGLDGVLSSTANLALGRDAGDGTLADRTITAATGNYADIIQADINGDGNIDIIAGGNGSVRIEFGDGQGGILFGTSFALASAQGVTIGDFNNDGKIDIVATSALGTESNIMLGNGDGTFRAASSFTFGAGTGLNLGLVTGDFDGDGNMDIASSAYTEGRTYIAFGRGDGTFSPQISIITGLQKSLSVGDFNNDGKDELVVNYTYAGVGVFSYDNSSGAFTGNNFFTGPTDSSDVGDINNDGFLDVVAAGYTGIMTVLLGNGDGSFKVSTLTNSEGVFFTDKLKVGDLNGDGLDDVTYISGNVGATTITTRLARADGTFGEERKSVAGTNLQAVGIIDLNGDGNGEIITADHGGTKLSIWNQNTTKTTMGQYIDLRTAANARAALVTLRSAMTRINSAIGAVGAVQSRIQTAYENLSVQAEQSRAAESRIRDADMAQESSDLIRKKILQDVSASIIAQANQQPALAIQLLRGGR